MAFPVALLIKVATKSQTASVVLVLSIWISKTRSGSVKVVDFNS